MGYAEPARTAYCLEDLARDGLTLMESLGIEAFGVIGISMGGMTALELLRLAPSKVKSLMLFCSLGPGDRFLPPPHFSEEEIHRIYGDIDQSGVEKMVEASTHADFMDEHPQRFREWVALRMKRLPDPVQMVFQAEAVSQYLKGRADLSAIRCPTLVLSGADDVFVDPRNSSELAREIPCARLKLFPHSSHLFFVEKPEEVALEILSFMESLCVSP